MADQGERTFKLTATLEAVERGQDLSKLPHMVVIRWLHEEMPWGEFETHLQALFSQPNPFTHPEIPDGPRVAKSPVVERDTEVPVTELTGVSKWPYIGVGSLVRSLDGRLVNEEFAPLISGVEPTELGVGSRIKFASIAVAQQQHGESVEEVLFAHPVTNAPNPRG